MTSPAPRDQAGPHPELQRKRTELQGPRRGLIGLLIIVAAAALTAGIAVIANPDRNLLQIDAPATSFRSTGVVLALLVGGSQAIAALLLIGHHPRARVVAMAAALIVGGWAVVQMTLAQATWFQISLFGIGALEVFLVAGCTPRETAAHKKKTKRRF